jgi:hypothetical protein
VDEALCDYRIHAGQSHERLALVHCQAIAILDRTFAAPGAAAVADLRADAYAQVHLRAAAEHYAAGDDEEGARAFRAAAVVEPAIVLDHRRLLQFLRRVLPDGHRSRSELVRRRRSTVAIARRAIAGTPLGPVDRWRARLALGRAALRLEWGAARARLRMGRR